MAKISKTGYRISGQFVEMELFYTSREGFYYKGAPDILNEFGFNNSARTEDALVSSIRAAIEKLHESNAKTELVILVWFNVASDIAFDTKTDENGRRHFIRNEAIPSKYCGKFRSNMDGYGFTLSWEIRFKKNNGNEVKYYDAIRQEDGSFSFGFGRGVSENFVEIQYQPETLLLLESIAGQVTGLAMRLIDFLERGPAFITNIALMNKGMFSLAEKTDGNGEGS